MPVEAAASTVHKGRPAGTTSQRSGDPRSSPARQLQASKEYRGEHRRLQRLLHLLRAASFGGDGRRRLPHEARTATRWRLEYVQGRTRSRVDLQQPEIRSIDQKICAVQSGERQLSREPLDR